MLGRPDNRERGRRMRDIGTYTAIPMMLVAGPVVGYLLGRWAAGRWGHETLATTLGAVLGFAAAVRQIWLLLRGSGGSDDT